MKKILSLCLSAAISLSGAAGMAETSAASASDIVIGSYVQMGAYNNEPILWRCVDIDENGPLMLSDRIICCKSFDADTSANSATGSHSRSSQLRIYGSNYWGDSNIRSWLNSSERAGNVKWLCGNPPSAEYVDYGDAYDREAGFLNAFTQSEINAVKPVSQLSLMPMPEIEAGITPAAGTEAHTYNEGLPPEALQNYDTAYAEYFTDKIFLLDLKQLNEAYSNRAILGEDYLSAKPAPESGGDNCDYWLRSPLVDKYEGQWVCTVSDGTEVISSCADNAFNGVRPAFYLDSAGADITGGNGTQSSPYTISAPSEPVITAPPEPEDPSGAFVKLGYVRGKAGDTVEMPLTLANNTGFSNIALEAEYDASVLTLVSVSENTGVGATFTAAQKLTANPYNMSWNSATSNNTFNGTLATLTFKISDSATSGNYPVELSFYKGRNGDYIDGSSVNYDIDHNPLGLSYVSGNVTVSEHSGNVISPISAHYYDELDKIEISAYLPEGMTSYNGSVIAALYDGNGRLTAVQISDASYYNGFVFENMTSNHTAKLMWWDISNNLRPIAESETITPGE